jgi:hypothetical protein
MDSGNGVVDGKRLELAGLEGEFERCEDNLRAARVILEERRVAIAAADRAETEAVREKWRELDGDPATKVMDRVMVLGAFGSEQRLRDSLSKAEKSVHVLEQRRRQLVAEMDAVRKEIHHFELQGLIEGSRESLEKFVKTARQLVLRYEELCRSARVMQEKEGRWNAVATQMGLKDPLFHLVYGTFLNLNRLGARGGVAMPEFLSHLTEVPNTVFAKDVAHWRLDVVRNRPAWSDKSEYGISRYGMA